MSETSLASQNSGAASFALFRRAEAICSPTSAGSNSIVLAFGLVLAGWLAVVAVTEAPAAFRAWEAAPHEHEVAPHGHDHASTDDALANLGIAAGHASLWPNTKPDEG
jgi:hypothetical protein